MWFFCGIQTSFLAYKRQRAFGGPKSLYMGHRRFVLGYQQFVHDFFGGQRVVHSNVELVLTFWKVKSGKTEGCKPSTTQKQQQKAAAKLCHCVQLVQFVCLLKLCWLFVLQGVAHPQQKQQKQQQVRRPESGGPKKSEGPEGWGPKISSSLFFQCFF